MKIISLNINDFGGANDHLMDHKTISKHGNYVIDWDYWSLIDKSYPLNKLLEYLQKECPSVLILQEFEINNSKESDTFHNRMLERGYILVDAIPKYPASITITYIKKEILYEQIPNPHHKRSLRASAIKIKTTGGDYIIYGTHVPPAYDAVFWDELICFYKENSENPILLIGDFNTYKKDTDSRKKFNELFNIGKNDAIDVWLKRGNPDSTPTEIRFCGRLDYAIASPRMYNFVKSMNIEPKLFTDDISDHAALVLEIS